MTIKWLWQSFIWMTKQSSVIYYMILLCYVIHKYDCHSHFMVIIHWVTSTQKSITWYFYVMSFINMTATVILWSLFIEWLHLASSVNLILLCHVIHIHDCCCHFLVIIHWVASSVNIILFCFVIHMCDCCSHFLVI